MVNRTPATKEEDPWKMLARCRAESARKDKKFKSELRAILSEVTKRCDYYTRELRRLCA